MTPFRPWSAGDLDPIYSEFTGPHGQLAPYLRTFLHAAARIDRETHGTWAGDIVAVEAAWEYFDDECTNYGFFVHLVSGRHANIEGAMPASGETDADFVAVDLFGESFTRHDVPLGDTIPTGWIDDPPEVNQFLKRIAPPRID